MLNQGQIQDFRKGGGGGIWVTVSYSNVLHSCVSAMFLPSS